MEFALLSADLSNINMEVADRVAFEGLLAGFVAGDLQQSADPMMFETSMEGRPGQVRDSRLQGIEAVVQRQPRVLAEGNESLFLG